MKRLVRDLAERPLDWLPERSVESLNQFFSGYGLFGPPLWRDLLSFEFWLTERLYYPQDSSARWWRFIQLNSQDKCEGYELFCRLYSQYSRSAPRDIQPAAPEVTSDPAKFDFYAHLYAIGRKPGLYLGLGNCVELIASYLAGYFRGKKDARIRLTRDEKEFLRFEEWLRKTYEFGRRYPWYRLVEMWPRGVNSFQAFFAEYDAYLTNFGKKARGLEDLFEFVTDKGATTVRRRTKLSTQVIRSPNPAVWWRAQPDPNVRR